MKYLKRGVATLIPLLLVIQVISLLTTFILDIYTRHFTHLDTSILLIGVAILFFTIFFLGYASTHIKLFQRVKNHIDNNYIKKLPFIGTIYGFGNDVVSTFTNDVKNDMTCITSSSGISVATPRLRYFIVYNFPTCCFFVPTHTIFVKVCY